MQPGSGSQSSALLVKGYQKKDGEASNSSKHGGLNVKASEVKDINCYKWSLGESISSFIRKSTGSTADTTDSFHMKTS